MGLFSKKSKPADDTPIEVIGETSYIRAHNAGGFLLAEVIPEKYSEHEATAIQTDVLAHADTFANKIVMDLAHVQMLASAGIGSLIQLHQSCQRAGGKLVLCNIDDNIRMMLGVAKMDRLLHLATDRADAAGKLG
ncbi:MAG: STAS domain-containing protein [Phycisphaerales bacterium]